MYEEEATIEDTYDPNNGEIDAHMLVDRQRYFDDCIRNYQKNNPTENCLGGEK